MTTAYPLAWPDAWPRSKTTESDRFKTTLTKALDNVTGSLRLFAQDSGRQVRSVLISSNYTLGDRHPRDPGVAVYFTWDGLSTCIAVDRYSRIEANLQAIHYCLEAERTKLRHGGINLVRAAFRGYAALPPASAARPWYDVLGLRPNASADEIDAAYRRLAQQHHPDKGGSDAAMATINRAREEARAR